MKKRLEIERLPRFIAFLINMLFTWSIIGLFINWYLYAQTGNTLGSLLLGFKTQKPKGNPPGLDGSIMYGLLFFAIVILYFLTFFILFFYDIMTLENRNGNFVESILEQKKVKTNESIISQLKR